MSKNLIIIGTGSSILKYKQKIKWWSEKYDVMAWGMSYLYCHSNDITPKYFSYLDPHSATKSLDLLKNNSETTSIIYGNIVDQNYKTQQEYIGTSQLISPYSPKNQHEKIYKQYTNKLNYINKKIIPATTIKKLKKRWGKL